VNPNALPKKGARIVTAMSGGVDSSVAAAWLRQQGYDVIGISLQLHDMAEKVDNKFGTCCSLSDIQDARRVAEKMEFPFYVANMESEFNESVIDDFVHEYLSGRTPNPCVRCNEKVKFSRLMDWAMDLGADYLATGHYATVQYNHEAGQHELGKGVDPDKDQSYFLFTMRQEDLARTIFPVGTLQKAQVRELAKKLELGIANKPDSQEICFVQGRSYREFIEERVPPSLLKPGAIVDRSGQVLGQHAGLHHFTIGQRKGIGVASKDPLFVLAIRKDRNEVVVGPETALFRKWAILSHLHWVIPPRLDSTDAFTAKIRYRAKECEVTVEPMLDRRLKVHFRDPQRAVTPGQVVVLYRGGVVVGGGWIEDLALEP
jgi:tRNA-specific 2-thiouridylase